MHHLTQEVLTGSQFSTYRIGGTIQEAYQPTTMEEAMAVLQQAQAQGKALTILGWGGNSLIASQGISGVTCITRKLVFVEKRGENCFRLGAGVHLAKVAKLAQEHGLTGAEYMIGIPGTMGGAVRMNAGALGQETADVIHYAFIYNRETDGLEIWDKERLHYSYRSSAIEPPKHVILGAEMEFQRGNPEKITELMEKSVAFRKTHHPTEPNGGSVFRNPSREMPVGKMLDALGAKDWTEGGVRISPLHANFIVNVDQGSSTDVLKLMVRMKEAIQKQYGYQVHPENVFLGDATPLEQSLWQELVP